MGLGVGGFLEVIGFMGGEIGIVFVLYFCFCRLFRVFLGMDILLEFFLKIYFSFFIRGIVFGIFLMIVLLFFSLGNCEIEKIVGLEIDVLGKFIFFGKNRCFVVVVTFLFCIFGFVFFCVFLYVLDFFVFLLIG